MIHTFFQSFILLILVTNAFGNVPIFASVLAKVHEKRRQKIVIRECAIAYITLLVFMFIGQPFLEALQLSVVSLRIGGGVILLLIAIRMIFPEHNGTSNSTLEHEPFIVPLAIPLLAGPSAMSTVLLLASQGTNLLLHISALTAAAVLWLVIFSKTETLQRVLGPQVMAAFERLMGLILTSMAVEMLLYGTRAFIKTL